MDKHYGEIVEYVVRKKGYGITDLATGLHINRRTVYNWFSNKYLKEDIIFKIGMIIKHDFSKEFAELFTSEDFSSMYAPKITTMSEPLNDLWKDKYLVLLEKYNEMLIDKVTIS